MSRRTVVALTLAATLPLAPAASAQEPKAGRPRASTTLALSADTRAQLAARVVGHPDLPQHAAGHRLAAIRVTAEQTRDAADTRRTIVSVVLFDHTALEARRVTLDAATNQLLANERLPGRPQRSDDELAEAIAIIRRDPALRRLLDTGGVLDGGFIVDDPAGSRRRMLQLKLMTADRRSLLRTVVVDLTRGEVAQ